MTAVGGAEGPAGGKGIFSKKMVATLAWGAENEQDSRRGAANRHLVAREGNWRAPSY